MYRHRTPLQLLQVQEVHVVEGLGAIVAAKQVYPAAFFRGADGGTCAHDGQVEGGYGGLLPGHRGRHLGEERGKEGVYEAALTARGLPTSPTKSD